MMSIRQMELRVGRLLGATLLSWLLVCGVGGPAHAASTNAFQDRLTMVPPEASIVNGGEVTFTCQVSAPGAFTYQWAKDRALLRYGTNSSLTIANARWSDAGIYSVTVSDGKESGTVAGVLVVDNRPYISEGPPATLDVVEGATVAVPVIAIGTAPLNYQWFKNGNPVDGLTNASLTITNARLGDTGSYTVQVWNMAAVVLSDVVALSVYQPPVFTGVGPTNITVRVGGTISNSATASGGKPISWQWLKDGVELSGATNRLLFITNCTPADAGRYWVVATNMVGAVTSRTAIFTVYDPPAITSGPEDVTAVQGADAEFAVAATGVPAVSYQWRKDDQPLALGTNANLRLSAVQVADAGNYSVVVTNDYGSVTSRVARLTVQIPPSISTPPGSLTVKVGESAAFDVRAEGTAPLSYQWLKDGVPIAGANANSYTIASTSVTDAARYAVVVANAAGKVTSGEAILTVLEPPTIQTEPQAVVATNGSTATFRVAAVGTAPLSFRWLKDGVAIAGATSNLFSIPNVQPSDEGLYSVTITNVAGGVTSRTARLTVLVPPSVTTPPGSLTVKVGESATFDVRAEGTAPLSYQWLKDGVPIVGANTNSYTIASTSVTDAARYAVVVANVAGKISSGEAVLTVLEPPLIQTQPQPVAVTNGGTATFRVVAVGTQPLSYQWLKDGAVIPGATSNALTLPNAKPADKGVYSVTVTNVAGSASSQTAQLGVNTAPVMAVPINVPEATAQSLWTLTLSATDPDIPADVLTYGLVAGPAGMLVEPGTGKLSWTPGDAQAPSTNRVTVSVNDNGDPSLSDAKSFTVVVRRKWVAPVVTASPASLAVTNGNAASFVVQAVGTEPLRYQWYKDNTPLTGRTNSTLTLANVQLNDAGVYSVTVGNEAGTVLSAGARLSVYAPATLRGVATDALSKLPLAGVTVRLGDLMQKTGADGAYAFTNLPPGKLEVGFAASATSGAAPLTVQFTNTTVDRAYTLEAEKNGYSLYRYAPIELALGETKEWSFSLSPSVRGLRLVLNWGANPKDLDAHLLTPPVAGVNYHVQYSSRFFGQTNRPPYAQLDADETRGYGPETMTIASNVPGVYHFYVHNYQEEQGDTGPLTGSEAVVQIYSAAGLAQTIRVPTTGQGDYWDVCAIDGASGRISIVNQIGNSPPAPDTVGTGGGSAGGETATNELSTRFTWSFGDGQSGTEENPTHSYTTAGAYDVSLTVVTPDGRTATATKPGWIAVSGSGTQAPRLTIQRAGTVVTLSWQSADAGFVLESRANLATGNWLPVAAIPEVGADQTRTVRWTLGGQQYFRLRK